jgi:hypothetical protein
MTFEYTITEPADIVFDHLKAAGKKSPSKKNNPEPSEEGTHRLYGRFRFFFIPCSYSYLATIVSDPNKHRISMKAKIFSVLEIKRVYQLTPAGGVTRVRENVFVKGNSFLKRMARENLSGTDILLYTGMQKVGNYALLPN